MIRLQSSEDAIAVAGLAIAIWARPEIGRNWSGGVVLKQNHELIERGPYAHVRHPIDSGFLPAPRRLRDLPGREPFVAPGPPRGRLDGLDRGS